MIAHKANKTERWSYLLLFIFSVLFVFFNSKNSPLYHFNEWGDPNIYFSMGKGMMNGLIPYKDLFDHKGPLIFMIYGIGYLLSNDTFTGVYIIECAFLFLNLLFAFKITRIFLTDNFSFPISLCYAVLLFNKSYYGGSAEEFISAFITVSFYYFIVYFTDTQISYRKIQQQMFIHGLMFGLTFLIKLSVCVFWIPLFLAVFYDLIKQKKYKVFINTILYSIFGILTGILPFILYFMANNAFFDFYQGYIEFNSIYAEFQSYKQLLTQMFYHAIWLIRNDYISFILVLAGLLSFITGTKFQGKTVYKIAVILSFLFLYTTICMSKYIMTYAHIVMYIYAIPGIILIVTLGKKYIRPSFGINKTAVYIGSFLIILSVGILNKKLFNQDIKYLLRTCEYNYMQKEFASIVNNESNPTLLDLGLDHGIFTKANIIPSYKYFFYPNINYNLFAEIRDYQTELIEKKEPLFIVVGNHSYYYGYYKDMEGLKNNYELISVFKQNIEAFDDEVYLYKRKE